MNPIKYDQEKQSDERGHGLCCGEMGKNRDFFVGGRKNKGKGSGVVPIGTDIALYMDIARGLAQKKVKGLFLQNS